MNADGTATFAVAWNNYFNDYGGDGAEVYLGQLTPGRDASLGAVTYSGDAYASITPAITVLPFPSHAGSAGNPHLQADADGTIRSVWTDDENGTKDLTVHRLVAGSATTGTWVRDALPAPINTAASESQPFFDGSRLLFTRNTRIVSHAYRPTNGACASGYSSADCWGPEVEILASDGSSNIGEIFGVGEPTIARFEGKTYLYFVYARARAKFLSGSVTDFDLDAGFVELAD